MKRKNSIFDIKVKSKRRAKQVSIESPKSFRKSIYDMSHDKEGYTLKDEKSLYLAQNRAKAQLNRKNLSTKERKEFSEISKIKIPRYKKYDITQLKKGTNVEMEHTKIRNVAEKIAKDHLKENPDYYKKFNPKKKSKEYLVN